MMFLPLNCKVGIGNSYIFMNSGIEKTIPERCAKDIDKL